MTLRQARELLLLYRPGSPDALDPEMQEALEMARQDPALGAWFENQSRLQQKIRSELRALPVPPRPAIREVPVRSPVSLVRPVVPWWRRPVTMAAAAVVAFALGLAAFWPKSGSADLFVNFQSRMVSTALREYRMDLVTGNMPSLREHLRKAGAPADYLVPPALNKLHLTGGGALRWHNHPVSMICFDRGDKQMLFLFVLDRSALEEAAPENPVSGSLHELAVVSWTEGERVYLLAGPPETDFARKYTGS